MRRWIVAVAIIAAVVLIALLVFRGTSSELPGNDIRLGLVSSLTGEAAAWGRDLNEGIDLGIENVNAAGGVNGRPFKAYVEDDQGSPRVGANATMKLLSQDHIDVMSGVAVSTVANAMIPILENRKVLFISGGASSPSLTGASPYFFRTWPSDLEEALVAASYIYEDLGVSDVAVVHANDDYGLGLANPFAEEFERLGGTVVARISFEKGAGGFRPQVVKVDAAKPEMVFLAGTPRDMAQFIKQLREAGVEVPLFSVSGIKEQEVIEIGGGAVEGVRFVDASFDPQSNRPKTREFIDTFRARFNKDPGVLAASGYDSILVLAEAIERAGSTNAEDLRAALLALDGFPGAVGDISFNPDGNVHREVRISEIQNGTFVRVGPATSSNSPETR